MNSTKEIVDIFTINIDYFMIIEGKLSWQNS